MLKSIMTTALVMSAAITNAHAGGDVRVYGGTEIASDGFLTGRGVTVSAGVETGRFIGAFSPTSIRADLGYSFASESLSVTPSVFFPDAIAGVNEFDARSIALHVGPEWKFPVTRKLSVFTGVQVGIEFDDFDSEFVPADPSAPIPADFTSFLGGGSDTDFSLQVPVGLEYALTDRLGLVARYRFGGAAIGSNHAIEAGFSIRF